MLESKAREGDLEEFIRHDRQQNSPNRRNFRNQPEPYIQEITHWEDDDYINIIEHDPNDLSTPKDSGASLASHKI